MSGDFGPFGPDGMSEGRAGEGEMGPFASSRAYLMVDEMHGALEKLYGQVEHDRENTIADVTINCAARTLANWFSLGIPKAERNYDVLEEVAGGRYPTVDFYQGIKRAAENLYAQVEQNPENKECLDTILDVTQMFLEQISDSHASRNFYLSLKRDDEESALWGIETNRTPVEDLLDKGVIKIDTSSMACGVRPIHIDGAEGVTWVYDQEDGS